MFTGIVEEIGRLVQRTRLGRGGRLEIQAELILEDARLGDSIAVNGVCLTIMDIKAKRFSADVSPETMQRTTLAGLPLNSPVNLERAMKLGDRLGGHLVLGHVDGIGRVQSIREGDGAISLSISHAPEWSRYVVEKGSLAVDGISLTVVDADTPGNVTFAIIPATWRSTRLSSCVSGSLVNLEFDLIAKHIEKLLNSNVRSKTAPYLLL